MVSRDVGNPGARWLWMHPEEGVLGELLLGGTSLQISVGPHRNRVIRGRSADRSPIGRQRLVLTDQVPDRRVAAAAARTRAAGVGDITTGQCAGINNGADLLLAHALAEADDHAQGECRN